MACLRAYFLEHGATAAYKYALLAVALHIDHGHDVDGIVFFLEFLHYDLGRVRHLLVVVEQNFLAYDFGDEEARGLVGEGILAEGAQGSMLDVDFGTYPFVTSSNTVCAGVCTGLGVAPTKIGDVYGIFKAYCTRVGSGPFPTELFDEVGEKLRQVGHEFGATTGRPRRCGWLDMVALKYAVMINGVTGLIMMKADVMNDFDTIKIATSYRVGGVETDVFPYEVTDDLEPVYTEFKGWKCDICGIRRYEDFPAEFKAYVEFIEKATGVPVKIISVGPDREDTIVR